MPTRCGGRAFESSEPGYACVLAAPIAGMALHYRTDSTHFHAKLIQMDYSGWIAVGFAASPGIMIGAIAIVAVLRLCLQRIDVSLQA